MQLPSSKPTCYSLGLYSHRDTSSFRFQITNRSDSMYREPPPFPTAHSLSCAFPQTRYCPSGRTPAPPPRSFKAGCVDRAGRRWDHHVGLAHESYQCRMQISNPREPKICTLRNEVKTPNIDGHDPNPIAGGDDSSVCLIARVG